MTKQEHRIRARIKEIYNQKGLIAMMCCVRGDILISNAQVLTRSEMDRVILAPR